MHDLLAPPFQACLRFSHPRQNPTPRTTSTLTSYEIVSCVCVMWYSVYSCELNFQSSHINKGGYVMFCLGGGERKGSKRELRVNGLVIPQRIPWDLAVWEGLILDMRCGDCMHYSLVVDVYQVLEKKDDNLCHIA